jgi:hypothetical protein
LDFVAFRITWDVRRTIILQELPEFIIKKSYFLKVST